MSATNAQVAATFEEIADLLEIAGANPFRVRAYRTGARAVGDLGRSLAEIVAAGEDLTALPGIGKDLAGKIREMVDTGRLAYLEQVRADVPPGLVDLLRLPGLGPKRVKELREELGVVDLATLKAALDEGRVQQLKGFGEKLVARVREGLARDTGAERRHLLSEAEETVMALRAHLGSQPGVSALEVAGSYRRRRETVGDLDFVASCDEPARLMDAFVAFPQVEEVLAKGATKSSVRLAHGLQVDLRIVPLESHGAALNYFTGSKAHNIALRKRGIALGLKLNEYGVFRGDEPVAGRTEEDVYAALGLPYIEPELREDRGELDAAEAGALPRLVRLEDLRGDLQSHTTETDGRDTLEAMAEAARALGHEYFAITDHSKRVSMARGMDAKRLRAHARRIDALNETMEGITLLKGVEVDILRDGSLDLPDDVLDEMDVVVASIHYDQDLPGEEQTRRVLRAMENPRAHILGHPTGRILNRREGYALDLPRVLDAAAEQGWFVEVNAQPDRLDLDDAAARLAKERGVLVAISTDAHSVKQLEALRFGVGQARRAWLEKGDVLNTRPLAQLRNLLARK